MFHQENLLSTQQFQHIFLIRSSVLQAHINNLFNFLVPITVASEFWLSQNNPEDVCLTCTFIFSLGKPQRQPNGFVLFAPTEPHHEVNTRPHFWVR